MTTRVSNSLFFAHQRAMQRGLNLHFSPRSFNGFSSSSSSMMIMEWKLWVIFAAARSKALEPIFLNIVRKFSFASFFIYDYVCLLVSRVGSKLCLMNQIPICRVPRVSNETRGLWVLRQVGKPCLWFFFFSFFLQRELANFKSTLAFASEPTTTQRAEKWKSHWKIPVLLYSIG